MAQKITAALVKATKPTPRDFVIWDTVLQRFGLRVKPSGAKSFIIQYQHNGKSHRMKIGTHPAMKPEPARKKAQKLLGAVAEGADPAAEKRAKARGGTLSQLCDTYLADHARVHKRPPSVRMDESLIERIIKRKLGSRSTADITRADVAKLHKELRNTPRQANMVVALLSKMMNLAEQWGVRPDNSNPCRHVH